MWRKVLRYLQPGLLGFLGVTLFLWPRFSTYLPWEAYKLKILGTTLGLFGCVAFYFDHLLQTMASKLKTMERKRAVSNHGTLHDSMETVFKHVGEPRIIRIYALSTYMIQPIMRDVGVKANQCQILVYDPEIMAMPNNSENKENGDMTALIPFQEWLEMRNDNRVRSLEIRAHSFYPTEYFLLFDDRAVIVGHYLIQDDRFPKCDFQQPFSVTDDIVEDQLLIRKYLEVFDRLWNSKKVHQIPL